MRKVIFWVHLVSGLLTGIVIAIMSVTGIAIAFEHEILGFIDHKVSKITHTTDVGEPLRIEDMLSKVRAEKQEFQPVYFEYSNNIRDAVKIQNGKRQTLYVNPYTGEIKEPLSTSAHHVLHTLEEWHRYVGMSGKNRNFGKLITGVSNLVFLLLCLTGFYLWFPKKWIWRLFKGNTLLNKKARGKARDLNWHNVFGIWSLPVLIILAATAVVFSFGWAHDLVFILSGDKPPKHRDFRMMMVTPPEMKTPEDGVKPLLYGNILEHVAKEFPDWKSIGIRLPQQIPYQEAYAPMSVNVFLPALFSTMGFIPVYVDSFTGEILQETKWKDRSAGIRARVWARFLHTGEAFRPARKHQIRRGYLTKPTTICY